MNLDYTETWISRPDVCRCCLAASGNYDMIMSYFSESDVKEIYLDMLQETYGISLLRDHGGAMICTLCVSQLRLASAFKKQVLEAEKQLDLYFQETGNATKGISLIKDNVKIEESNQTVTAENFKTKSEKSPESTLKLKNVRNRVRNKRLFKTLVESENGEIDPGYDSDIPIAELIKTSCQEKSLSLGNAAKDIKNDIIGVHKVRNRISERKRVILTCSIVLKDTTACPFRHHKSWFQCFFCLLDFMDINTLKKHTTNNHKDIDTELKKLKSYPRSLQIDISNLKCRHCCLTLTDVNSMQRHLVEVHNKVIYTECIADYKVNSSPYSCHICKREFHVFRTLTSHLNEHYPNCICDVCGKSFLNTKRLKVHKRTHENGTYPCKKCGKVLKTKISITNHMETHSKRVIICQICLKPMKHYNARIKHMSEEHNITYKFKCPICYREYNIKHYLATHMRQTHGNKNKKCTECDMAFITNHGLKKHMLKHTGEKPYNCTVCCKSYARSYTLREHMRAHVDKNVHNTFNAVQV